MITGNTKNVFQLLDVSVRLTLTLALSCQGNISLVYVTNVNTEEKGEKQSPSVTFSRICNVYQ